MNGKWIKIVETPHPCYKYRPKLNRRNRKTIYVGSIWECECGQQWKATWEYLGDRTWMKWDEK